MQYQALRYTPVTDNKYTRITTNGPVHCSLKPLGRNVQVERLSVAFSKVTRRVGQTWCCFCYPDNCYDCGVLIVELILSGERTRLSVFPLRPGWLTATKAKRSPFFAISMTRPITPCACRDMISRFKYISEYTCARK